MPILLLAFGAHPLRAATPPVSPSPVISSLTWAPSDTIVRLAPGSDNWPITWADDGDLYTAYGDGFGFEPFVPNKLSLGFAKVSGPATDFNGTNIIPSDGEQTGSGPSGKKASGMLMVEGTLYMWVRNANNNGEHSQLAWSADHGVSWTFSSWTFTEFGYPTFLNFGQNYSGAPGDYVYSYSHDHPSAYQPADRFILMRVPKTQITTKASYEFFRGLDGSGIPIWTSDITQRASVFDHPGRCQRSGISFNPGIKRYLWWQMYHEDGVDNRFEGGFGIYDAPNPWGPWTTVYFTPSWDVGPGETGSFPTKWMSSDGKTLYLVFSGDDAFSVRKATLTLDGGGGVEISNLSVASGEPYEWFNLAVNEPVYIDRAFVYQAPLPSFVAGAITLRTANDDKLSTGSSFVTFELSAAATVYVAHDDRITTKPDWMADFADTGADVPTTMGGATMSLWARTFPAGTVTLGGNISGGQGFSMYTVMVTEPVGGLLETGQASWTQSTGWRTVTLQSSFSDPIVVMGPHSFNGGDSSTIRVRNVTSNSFEFQIDEWDYLDGNHGADETIGFLVVEAGSHTIGGLAVEAGSLSVSHNWVTGSLGAFGSAPVIVSQTVTTNDSSAVATRMRNIGAASFQVRLQEEEAADGTHSTEEVHYIAIEPGTSTENFKAGITPDAVDQDWFSINFGGTFTNPVFLGAMQSFDGIEPAYMRHRNLVVGSVQVKVEEEKSADSEVVHNDETVGWFIFGN